MCSISTLYVWFFVYFVQIEESNWQTMDKILLILLLFAVPQVSIHSYIYGVLKTFAEQIDDEDEIQNKD